MGITIQRTDNRILTIGDMGAVQVYGGKAGGAGVLFFDTFTDANGTALNAHTPDTDTVGGGWTQSEGTNKISGNKVAQFAAAADRVNISVANTGAADVVITCDITYDSSVNRSASLFFRFTDTTHTWEIALYSGSFLLIEQNAGATTRDTSSPSLNNGQTYEVRVALSGNSISATVDGGDAVSYTSALFNAATSHGIKMVTDAGFAAGNLAADNFRVVSN